MASRRSIRAATTPIPNSLYLTGTIYGSGYGKVPRVVDELKTAKLAVSLPAPAWTKWFSDIDFGLNYADREKNKRQPEGNINLGAQGNTTIASDLQFDPVDLGFAGVGYIPAWNVPGAVARYMTFEPSATAFPYLVAKAWDVNEETTTAYLRGNIDTEWGDVSVRGNVGVQIQRVDQSSDAIRLSGRQRSPADPPGQDHHRRAPEHEPGVRFRQRPDLASGPCQAGGASARGPVARFARSDGFGRS